MKNTAIEFYSPDTNGVHVPVLSSDGQNSVFVSNADVLTDTVPESVAAEFSENISALYDSIEPRSATASNGHEYSFEIAVVGTGDDVTLDCASFKSSATENKGNGYERARSVLNDPTRTIVYIGTMGMGIASPMTAREQRYLAKHGSLLDEEGNGLPVVEALGKVLHDMGIAPVSARSDSFGRIMSAAYCASYGAGNITSVHHNVPPNVFDIHPLRLPGKMMIQDKKLSDAQAELTPDVFAMGADKLDFTNASLSEAYRARVSSGELKHKTSVPTMIANMVACGRGLGSDASDPLLRDLLNVRRTNPGAMAVYTFGSRDPLIADGDVQKRLSGIISTASLYGDMPVKAAVVEGSSHSLQTHTPQFLERLTRALLDK